MVYKHLFYIFVKAWFGSDVGICSGTLVKSPFPLYLFMEMFLFFSGKETEFPIEPELTLELMMAANYLHTWIIISWAASPAQDLIMYYSSRDAQGWTRYPRRFKTYMNLMLVICSGSLSALQCSIHYLTYKWLLHFQTVLGWFSQGKCSYWMM